MSGEAPSSGVWGPRRRGAPPYRAWNPPGPPNVNTAISAEQQGNREGRTIRPAKAVAHPSTAPAEEHVEQIFRVDVALESARAVETWMTEPG